VAEFEGKPANGNQKKVSGDAGYAALDAAGGSRGATGKWICKKE